MRKQIRNISFTGNAADWDTYKYASIGLSAQAISERTGLTRSQVFYRLRMAGMKLRNYRNGGAEAERVIALCDSQVWPTKRASREKKHLDIRREQSLSVIRSINARKREKAKKLRK